MTHLTAIAPRTSHRRAWQALTLGLTTLLGLAGAGQASAQSLSLNFGLGFGLRFENSTNHDGPEPLGQARLVMNAYVDGATSPGPYILTLEQGGTVVASGACEATAVVYSGEAQENLGFLRECTTEPVPSASIRTNAPISVVVALVNEATDARTEVYRGQFPVYAAWWWDRNDGDRAIHIEHRALRMDSFFGAGFVRQYISDSLRFAYVDTAVQSDVPREHSFRCKVGAGEWRVYEGTLWAPFEHNVRNRVWLDGTVHEDGAETLITRYYNFDARSMPVSVVGSSVRPSAGTSMDGAWTCELRTGSAANRVVAREFRFDVQNGYIQHHAVEAQFPVGRDSAMVSIGLNPANMPAVFDPALVRATIAGRALTGATAPLVSPLPARASNPSFTTPRAAPAARGGGRRR